MHGIPEQSARHDGLIAQPDVDTEEKYIREDLR